MLGFDLFENLTQLSDANQHPHIGVEFHCQLDLVEPTPMFIHHHRAVGFRPPSGGKGLTGTLQSGVGFVKFAVELSQEKLTIAEVRSRACRAPKRGELMPWQSISGCSASSRHNKVEPERGSPVTQSRCLSGMDEKSFFVGKGDAVRIVDRSQPNYRIGHGGDRVRFLPQHTRQLIIWIGGRLEF